MTTNQTNKKKSSAARKLIPAVGMLTASAMMLASSTYAWFTMNKEVEVTGMEIKTKVGKNLLICTTNLNTDYSSNTLDQKRAALLEPVSSINGATGSFYYTVDAKANGAKNLPTSAVPYVLYSESADTAVANDVAGKVNYDSAFNLAYDQGNDGVFTSGNIKLTKAEGQTAANDGAAYGYVDYIFYLKATSDQASQAINMTQCDLDYNSAAIAAGTTVGVDIDRAWRVAVFSQDVSSDSPGTGWITTDIATAANQKGLLSLANAVNHTSGKAVTSPTALGDVVDNASESGVVIGTVGTAQTPSETKYFKVVVRLWLEGEDTTCNSTTYAALTDYYTLDLKFEIAEGTAVKQITTGTFEPTTDATQVGTHYDAETYAAGA